MVFCNNKTFDVIMKTSIIIQDPIENKPVKPLRMKTECK